MKKYPVWIREKIFEEIKEGKSAATVWSARMAASALSISTTGLALRHAVMR